MIALVIVLWRKSGSIATAEVKQKYVYIFTDSICSELQINKYLLQPEKFRFHTHKDLIGRIAEQTKDRALAGGRTHILKVKGHAGILGNEEADAVAGLARQLVTEGKGTDKHTGHIEAIAKFKKA